MNQFNFFLEADIPDDIYKSANKAKGEDKYNNMIVYGMASDNTKDLQEEILEPSGYDIDDFLKSGLLNLEHYTTRKGDPSFWIGEPIEAEVKDNKFFIKGKLWKNHPLARNFWDTMLIMKSSGSTRKPGWSIEGKTIEVDPNNKKRITKAKIKHCALTFSPINSNSWVDIVKGNYSESTVKDAFTREEIEGRTYILQFEKDDNIITINKDYSVDIKPKSMDTESLKPLTKESLSKKEYKVVDWDTIMKGIKKGWIEKEKLPQLIKKLTNSFNFK